MMQEFTERVFLRYIRLAVTRSDAGALTRAIASFATFCYRSRGDHPWFEDEFFREYLQLAFNARVLTAEKSHPLLLFFQYEWARITELQRADLLQHVADAYPRFADATTCLALSELLGSYFPEPQGYEVLRSLEQRSEGMARAYVADGLYHVVKRRDAASRRALKQLEQLSEDRAEDVREMASWRLACLEDRAEDERDVSEDTT